ncbi:MAG: hypothetical protein JW720_09595 [Sedimentisphaerales bacterium]|nr:hypothetical protein [Sedimentisphaerales bacterium]
MPPHKRQQSNAMLYTLIAFVGLFMAAATAAIIFYVKSEDYKTKEEAASSKILEIASPQEQTRLGSIVGTRLGTRQNQKTWFGTLAVHLDSALTLVTGTIPQDTNAKAKLDTALQEVEKAIALAQEYVTLADADPNTIGLTTLIADLKTELDNKIAAALTLQNQLAETQQTWQDARAAMLQKEDLLQAEKNILQQQVNAITADYDKLRTVLEQTTDQRVQNVMTQLDEEKANRDQLNQDLLKTQAQLGLVEERMKAAQEKVAAIMPPPDSNAPAMVSDGKIILVDLHTKIVHINKGSDDHVYQGLTFAVHDKNAPLPKDGKGKAEIEVFDVQKTISAARIINADARRPILRNDVISNLIWDADKKNVFVIAGDFNLDNKGGVDDDAVIRMKALIEKWGARVDDAVSVDTDFLILGNRPAVLRKPTFEQIEIDPQAMDKYEASVQARDNYDKILSQAQNLWIPIFTYDRFLNFTGYKQQSANAGAF